MLNPQRKTQKILKVKLLSETVDKIMGEENTRFEQNMEKGRGVLS